MGIKKAKSVVEYTVCAAIIIAGLIGINVYFTRALRGNIKAHIDGMSPLLFSPQHSSYKEIQLTPEFKTQRITTSGTVIPESGDSQPLAVYERDLSHRVTMITSGNIKSTLQPAFSSSQEEIGFFSNDAPDELKTLFANTKVEVDYSIENETSVVDTFSDKKLCDDKSFKQETGDKKEDKKL